MALAGLAIAGLALAVAGCYGGSRVTSSTREGSGASLLTALARVADTANNRSWDAPPNATTRVTSTFGNTREPVVMQIGEVDRLTQALAGVRRTAADGLAQWRYHGRLVARQLDDAHLVIRADFDYRDWLLRQFPGTFSVPARYSKHMMVVADLVSGDAGAIEDALEAAWRLQRGAAG